MWIEWRDDGDRVALGRIGPGKWLRLGDFSGVVVLIKAP